MESSAASPATPLSRRRFVAASGAGLGASLLAACGAQGASSGSGAQAGQTGQGVARSVRGTVTWLVRPQQVEQDWQDKVVLPRMKELHPQIDLQREISPVGAAWPDKVFAMHAAGTPADVHNGVVGTFIQLYAQGKLAELGPLVARDKLDLKLFGGFEKDQDMCRSGKQWALPVLTTLGEMTFYNASLLEAAGVPVPTTSWTDRAWTVDALLDGARKTTKNAGQADAVYGIQPVGGTVYHQYAYLWNADPFPTEFYAQGLAQQTTWTAAGVVEAIQWYADLSRRHGVAVKRGDASRPFAQGGAAFWLQQGWGVSDLRDVTSFKWGLAPLPWKATNKSVSFTDCILITKDTKALDASWELVKYLTGKDGQIEYSKATGRPPTRTDAFDPWLDATLQLPGIAIKSKDQLRSLATGYLGNHVDNWAHYVVNAAPLQAIMTETETKFLTGELGVPAAMIDMKQRMDTQLRDTYEQFKSSPLVRDTRCT